MVSGVESRVETRGWFKGWVVRSHARGERFDLPALDSTLDVFLEGVQFDSIDFSDIQFEQFSAAGSTLVRCDFSNARFGPLHFGLPQAPWGWRHLIRPGGRRYPETTYEECVFRRTRFDPPDEIAMPAQQGLGADQEAGPGRTRQAPAETGEQETVSRPPARPLDLALEDAELVPED